MPSIWTLLGARPLDGRDLGREALAALVVFLIALPLSLGVALASGVPPEAGLISAIVGGLVVGRLAGSPLQVSGPAAGLAVLVYAAVQQHGLAALGAVVLIAGLVQLAGGALRLGRWFTRVPGSVTSGMLAGIGALILASQAHVMMDLAPTGTAIGDALALAPRLAALDASSASALGVGLATLGLILAWERWRPARLAMIPGALVGVAGAVALTAAAGLPVAAVAIPERLLPEGAGWLPYLSQPAVWGSGVALGVVASAEALLSASAVDGLHDGPRTDHDRELVAQGVGNLVAGLLGALPVTGVIVRSSANVQAGATTRLPAMGHALALLVLVAALPSVLGLIPTAALAAVLVRTGAGLLSPAKLAAFWRDDRAAAAAFAITAGAVVSVGLLEGVLLGLATAGLANLTRRGVAVAPREAPAAMARAS